MTFKRACWLSLCDPGFYFWLFWCCASWLFGNIREYPYQTFDYFVIACFVTTSGLMFPVSVYSYHRGKK